MMHNFKQIAQLPDQEFLSLLYAERERQQQRVNSPGWSIWVIIVAVFTLFVYVYSILKENNGNLDWLLCYYIYSLFCPIAIYLMLMSDVAIGFKFGDNRHIATVGENCPLFMLSFQLVIAVFSCIAGILVGASDAMLIVWGSCAIPSLMALLIASFCRKQYVTTFSSLVVSKSRVVNNIVFFIIFGVVLMPVSIAQKKLSVGFSIEFEFAISIVFILLLLYVLIRIIWRRSERINYDELIDKYLYYDVDKLQIVEQLGHMVLGKRPFEVLLRDYDELVAFSKEVPGLEDEVKYLVEDLSTKNLSINDAEMSIEKIKVINTKIKSYLSKVDIFLKRCKAILSLKTTVQDEEFVAMISCLPDFPNVYKIQRSCQEAIEKIEELINPYQCTHCGGMCERTDCSDRNKPMSLRYKFYHKFCRFIRQKTK